MAATIPDCIFCKIVAGQIPCMQVYGDDDCLAFLDIGPLAQGHLLLIPREHFGRLEEVPPEALAKVCSVLPRLGSALVDVTGAAGYNVLLNNGAVAGQEVPHVHFHLIPRVEGDGLGYRWNRTAYAEGRIEELGGQLRAAVDKS